MMVIEGKMIREKISIEENSYQDYQNVSSTEEDTVIFHEIRHFNPLSLGAILPEDLFVNNDGKVLVRKNDSSEAGELSFIAPETGVTGNTIDLLLQQTSNFIGGKLDTTLSAQLGETLDVLNTLDLSGFGYIRLGFNTSFRDAQNISINQFEFSPPLRQK